MRSALGTRSIVIVVGGYVRGGTADGHFRNVERPYRRR